MKKLLSILAAVGLTATSSSVVVSCGKTNASKKDNVNKLDIEQIKSNDGGLFQFVIKNVTMDSTISYDDLSNHFGIFDANGKKTNATFEDGNIRQFIVGKSYDLNTTMVLFNDGGHDRDVNETFTFGVINSDKTTSLKTVIGEFSISHKKVPDVPLTLEKARVIANWNKGDKTAYQNFTIVINALEMHAPYGAYDNKMAVTANLKNKNTGEVSHPEIKKMEIPGNGWNINIDFASPIKQLKDEQALTFSVQDTSDTVKSESDSYIVPALDNPSIKLANPATVDNMENPIHVALEYSDIDNPDQSKFKGYINNKEVKVSSMTVAATQIILGLDTDPVGPGDTIKITYDSSKGLLTTEWSW